jgi:hypothetical protein
MKPVLMGPASPFVEPDQDAFFAAYAQHMLPRLRSAAVSAKKEPARWGRAGSVLLGRRCCYEVRRVRNIGALT